MEARVSSPHSKHHNIPDKLKQIDAWMGTCFERRPDDKLNKPPYRIDGKRAYKADKTNPKNWSTFAEAATALEASVVDAIGFVFTGEESMTVVDLDGAIDIKNGEMSQKAAHVVASLDTYTEVSVSQTGLHSICIGKKP